MLFNSNIFMFVFLPLVFSGFFLLARLSHRAAALWLAAASIVFYGWWDYRFIPLLLASIVFNYLVGRQVFGRPWLLVLGIAANLALLGYFKYANFFIQTVDPAYRLDIVLPIGISFFTFTQIAFLADAAKGLAREYDFVKYVLFVTYFPHLVAGPILHHKEMMPQFDLDRVYRLDLDNVAVGLSIFLVGIFKKVVIADSFAGYADHAFAAAAPSFMEAWAGALAYTLQLYFDFSGYSDMAIGLSFLFGIRLPLNFDSPYQATSIIDFWRRWHMTLSRFLRDYLYIPLGGNRDGNRWLNLMITMVLGGLWHGAAWTFVVWGALHGAYLVLNRAWRAVAARRGYRMDSAAARLAAGGLTFLAVVFAWVFFRAESMTQALAMLRGMAGVNGMTLPPAGGLAQVALIIAGLAIVWGLPNTQQVFRRQQPSLGSLAASRLEWAATWPWALAIAAMFTWSLMLQRGKSVFLYFQF